MPPPHTRGPRAATGVHRPPPQEVLLRRANILVRKQGPIPYTWPKIGAPVKVTVVLSVEKKQQVPVPKECWHSCQADRTNTIGSNSQESLNARHLRPADATHQGEKESGNIKRFGLSFVVAPLPFIFFLSSSGEQNKTNITPRTHTNQPTKQNKMRRIYLVEDEAEYAMRDDTREQLGRDFPTNRIGRVG